MDEVLREALALSDPDALFGEHQVRPVEYRGGELITPDSPAEDDLLLKKARWEWEDVKLA